MERDSARLLSYRRLCETVCSAVHPSRELGTAWQEVEALFADLVDEGVALEGHLSLAHRVAGSLAVADLAPHDRVSLAWLRWSAAMLPRVEELSDRLDAASRHAERI